ncbi:MAG: DUF5009 domain-containing protein [Saprospiraceae bacterium]
MDDNDKQIAPSSDRLLSLDILRGFDMMWITGGEGLIHALAVATGWSVFEGMSHQLHHVEWAGFVFYDLIFPLFMFISGVAIPFALSSKLEQGVPRMALFKKVARRLGLLVLLGIIYNQFWLNDWANPRIASVLAQIGVGYFFAAIIFMQSRRFQGLLLWLAGILIGYGILQLWVPVPGFGPGVLTREGSINAYIDQLLLPGMLLRETFDPEGVLNMLSGTGITLMGVIAGLILRKEEWAPYRKVLLLSAAGILLLLLAFLLKDSYPIIKRAWTSTFNLQAGGVSFLLMALFYLVVDVWKYQRWGFYFKVIGVNAIAVYLGAQFIDIDYIVQGLIGGLTKHLGDWGEVWMSVGYLVLVWAGLYILYRKKIFIKV